jgi:hypothetical protein
MQTSRSAALRSHGPVDSTRTLFVPAEDATGAGHVKMQYQLAHLKDQAGDQRNTM